ncbi:hypothetical protein [Cetobacterium sp.]|uniref:hypothetical protein n=1 Tax=Cetobacterium sp. TaxID=2071632 RepID=UPI003F3CC548
MYVSSKHIQIGLIIKQTKIDDYKTIAKLLNINSLSLFVCIKDIEKIVWEKNEFDIKTLIIKIRESKDIIFFLKKHQKITKAERILYTTFKLLDERFINMNQIAEKLEVTRRSLNYDLESIKTSLSFYKLKLIIHKNQGLNLIGSEENIRRMHLGYIFKIFIEKKFLPKIINKQFEIFLKKNSYQKISQIINSIPIDSKNYVYYNDLILASSILAFTNKSEQLPKEKVYLTQEISLEIPTCTLNYLYDILNNKYYVPENYYSILDSYKTEFESIINNFFKIKIEPSFYKNFPIEKWLMFFIFKDIFNITDLYYTNILNRNIPQNVYSLIKKLQKQIPSINFYDGLIIHFFILDYINQTKEIYKNIFIYSNLPIPLSKVTISRIENIYNIKLDKVIHSKDLYTLFTESTSIKYNLFSFENLDFSYKNTTFKKISLSKFFESEN